MIAQHGQRQHGKTWYLWGQCSYTFRTPDNGAFSQEFSSQPILGRIFFSLDIDRDTYSSIDFDLVLSKHNSELDTETRVESLD